MMMMTITTATKEKKKKVIIVTDLEVAAICQIVTQPSNSTEHELVHSLLSYIQDTGFYNAEEKVPTAVIITTALVVLVAKIMTQLQLKCNTNRFVVLKSKEK